MKKIVTLLLSCAFVTMLSAQNFIKFDAVDGNGVKAANGLAHRTGASLIEILVPENFDVSNVTIDYEVAETDEVVTNPLPANFTTPQTISVKGASSTKNWNVTFKKVKPATLPFDLAFSAGILSSDWNSNTLGWVSGCIDPAQNKVVRFGNVTSTFIVAFTGSAETVSYAINGVGSDWGAGIFDVYVSADGQSWTSQTRFDSSNPMPLSTLTDFSFNPSNDTRYVKWVYTNRVINVTMNNITITKGNDTGIADHTAISKKIYANNNQIILPDVSAISTVEIYSIIGLSMKSITNPDSNINLSAFPKGIYIAKATTMQGKSEVVKFTIK